MLNFKSRWERKWAGWLSVPNWPPHGDHLERMFLITCSNQHGKWAKSLSILLLYWRNIYRDDWETRKVAEWRSWWWRVIAFGRDNHPTWGCKFQRPPVDFNVYWSMWYGTYEILLFSTPTPYHTLIAYTQRDWLQWPPRQLDESTQDVLCRTWLVISFERERERKGEKNDHTRTLEFTFTVITSSCRFNSVRAE